MLGPLFGDILPYIDDMFGMSDTTEGLANIFWKMVLRMKRAGIRLHPQKLHILDPKQKILGNYISDGYLHIDENKVKAIREMPRPATVKQLRSYLGAVNYLKRYIDSFSKRCRPLYDLLAGETPDSRAPIIWNDACEEAFQDLNDRLTRAPALALARPDRKFVVTTDASKAGMGFILEQEDEKKNRHIIEYGSKSFNETEKRWSSFSQELKAIVCAIDSFRHYLMSAKTFTVKTDCISCLHLRTMMGGCTRDIRNALHLSNYQFTLEHTPGTSNKVADCLSRVFHLSLIHI